MKSIDDIAAALQGYDPQALSVNQVNAFLHELVQPVSADESQDVFLMDALGRVLAADVISPISVPAHNNSAMDGFAFNAAQLKADQPLTLRVVDTALAGKAWQGKVNDGECLKIMTGAILPDGLDTIAPQEFCQVDSAHDVTTITIPPNILKAGDNRRLLGEDLMQGQPALKAGQHLTPAALGLVASLGLPDVRVHRRLRVAYFSTGDEVMSLGEAPREGAVYDSNRFTVFGLLTRMGCEVIDMGVVRDEPALLEAAFAKAALEADAIITSGGVSVGEADFTKAMMKKLGDVAFWRIAMRPGRPMAVGRIGKSVLFGLPGNPVAVMVTFLAFVRPALLRMMGSTAKPAPLLRAKSLEPMRKKAGRTEYQRGFVSSAADGMLQVQTTGNQGSGVLSSMVQGNGLIVLHHGQGNVAVGDEVDVLMFEGAI
ncbi:MAG: molybdopterin molybdenumtransferase MoeA [Burkholderiales bacterium 35-55-47]|jgi:molybdopterin molybdotransferase|uniref:molybdopterin molybdotransferase MoeA n=1 Tax=Limnohabitans sp. TaxID=1907725 RepID=UPI000BD0EEA4|nr:gephyrin-like molybdotransferase Glp [Limnohabitans sp.]OYY17979.1 MAG: molybdopterin molybdenumtransferase MoeA [Burkholderiales bacterium 35-55-47]OYZ73483.1 MAG: molybdopterin molybdenumtransferase MoeA [Burkholderiales bacterium 24-55-52]OZB00629.1 MAG: molybdopterin molybdenumtransferase MoeA [Burkholderiales bacterium 39-55-53]HQR85627.1 molybdopterin molybdotransferase MoeA [Limnohabitans sp.]HQS26456.1 molybdopterin molybdotransferase MoeA [Limnohabitans sp.]